MKKQKKQKKKTAVLVKKKKKNRKERVTRFNGNRKTFNQPRIYTNEGLPY